jgi:hypothetical protein
MTAHKSTFLLFMCCLALAAASWTALAQGMANIQQAEYYQGMASNTPQCPAIRYLFRGISSNPIGYVWFTDASGMSKATGTMDLASGQFH